MTNYQKLEARFRQISALEDLRSIAGWDEAVMMPAGGGPSRGRSLSELGTIIQNLSTEPQLKDWLEGAEGETNQFNDWQKANLREMRRIYLEQTAIPVELNQKLILARMTCEQKWRQLRAKNDWAGFLPHLQELLNLTREMYQGLSKVFGLPVYDTALNMYSRGLNEKIVETLFTRLRSELPGLIESVLAKQKHEHVIFPLGEFPMHAQKTLGLELMQAVGFSMDHGRLDESHHPFCGGTPRDVRITTRYNQNEFVSSLMGVLHETGHALYEQHLPEAWLGQPVGSSAGMSIHESQSLFMEMQVCRSREFMEFAFPYIERFMGPHMDNKEALTPDNLHKLVTRAKRGLIRVDADEVTYPAHVILRFEIERDLLLDKWPLKELPTVWNEKMKGLLGLSTLGNDKNGCMQDVHWPSGAFGYFPAYTFGAVIAAQLFKALESQTPDIRQKIGKGDLASVRQWLNDQIWSQGSLYSTQELVEKATGPLSADPFLNHLNKRYLNAH